MHQYMTRAMVASKPLTYDGQSLQPGDEFYATAVDADYLIKCKRASDAEVKPTQPAAVALVVAPADDVRPAPELPAETPAPHVDAASDVSVDAPADPSAEATPQEQPRRRGRPTNAERAARAAEAAEASE